MNLLIDKKTTKQVRIDAGVHKLLKITSAKDGRTIRDIVEECLADYLFEWEKQNG